MAHYAFLDDSNCVVNVIVGRDEGELGIDWEEHYSQFAGMRCLRTSYNARGGKHSSGGPGFRKNYAGIGYTYDSVRDAFIPPKPYSSWVLDEDTCLWVAPVVYPEDGKVYRWDESILGWVGIEGGMI